MNVRLYKKKIQKNLTLFLFLEISLFLTCYKKLSHFWVYSQLCDTDARKHLQLQHVGQRKNGGNENMKDMDIKARLYWRQSRKWCSLQNVIEQDGR